MLPRQNKNAIQISINKDDDAEDIEAKKELRNEFQDPIFWGAFVMIGME